MIERERVCSAVVQPNSIRYKGADGHPIGLQRIGEGRLAAFLVEFWEFMRVRKKYWLMPVLIVSLLLGGLIVLTQGSAVAPFIYTLF
jgi:hypothetical protein